MRVALKMGYHRDGSHFPDFSPYAVEMQRRTWYILMQFDTASASLVGLPRIIKETQCDTTELRNLRDEDFDDNSTALQSARPQNNHTLFRFLLATTVLFFNMGGDVKKQRPVQSMPAGDETVWKITDALKRLWSIWEQQQGGSKEAQTAVEAINMVLAKVENVAQPRNLWIGSSEHPGTASTSTSPLVASILNATASAV